MGIVVTIDQIKYLPPESERASQRLCAFGHTVDGEVLTYHALLLLAVIILGENAHQSRHHLLF